MMSSLKIGVIPPLSSPTAYKRGQFAVNGIFSSFSNNFPALAFEQKQLIGHSRRIMHTWQKMTTRVPYISLTDGSRKRWVSTLDPKLARPTGRLIALVPIYLKY